MSTHTPLVSIIIPVYNCEAFLINSLKSIIEQTYNNLEILICDDCSTDDSWKIINAIEDSRIIKFRNPVNLGTVKTKNFLLNKSQGEFITFHDSDDISKENRIEKQVNLLLRSNTIGACGTNSIRLDINGNSLNQTNYPTGDKTIKENILRENFPFTCATIMVRREIVEKTGGFDLFFDRLICEDSYWITQIADQCEVANLPEALYYYRTNPYSLTNQLTNLRKLTIVELVDKLNKQQLTKGSNWLKDKDFKSINNFEESLLSSRKWLAKQYRIYAAVKIDQLDFKTAATYLQKSITLNPWSVDTIKTLSYFVRKNLFRSK